MGRRTFKKVVRVEMHCFQNSERTLKDERTDYAHGGYCHVTRIERCVRMLPYVFLECGHYREQDPGTPNITNAKRLMCWECESGE